MSDAPSLQSIEEAFHRAADLAPDARAKYLAELRAQNESLHAEVAALLDVSVSAERRLQGAIDGAAVQLLTAAASARVGVRLGPYELVELLGEGGMGSVYRAVRADSEYQRDVAIKVLRPGAAHMVSRLRDERQILAALDHPGIVRLLDGGSTDDGAPYLVLEYIEGVPITEYVRSRPIRARLRLMLRVCEIVQYAHQRFVVHRDIKPSNVLVSANGDPKLLDFGIAKLLADAPAQREAHTRTGFVPMTPAYASPEQVRGEAVSTASDVYSLGALLFEILAGAPPHEPSDNPVETLRVICEVVPPRPSSVAPVELRAAIAGDLDNIVAKALHKDPTQRYATVDALASDLHRYLEGQPVVARAPTLIYRARKFARRHSAMLALGAVVMAILVASTVWSLREAHRADREATRAAHGFAEGRKLAQTLVFEVEEQLRYLKGATAVRQRILDAALAYLDNLTASAADDADLARELALAYMKLGAVQGDVYAPSTGQLTSARQSYEKAFALLDRMTTERDAPATRSVRITGELAMGILYQALGELPRATEQLRSALARADELPGDAAVSADAQLRAYTALAFLPKDAATAAHDFERMSKIAEAWRAREPDSLEARYWAALVHEMHGVAMSDDPAALIAELRVSWTELEDLARTRPTDARFLRDRAVVETSLAGAYGGTGNVQLWLPSLGDVDAALPYARAAIATITRLVERDPDDVRLRSDLAGVYATLGALLLDRDPAESVVALERALTELDELPPSMRAEFYTRQNEWLVHCTLPPALARVGRGTEVDAVATRALEMAETIVSGMRGERTVAMCRYLVAHARIALGQRDRAAALLEANVDELGRVLGQPDAPVTSLIGFAQSLDLLATLRPADSCALARRAADAFGAWPRRTVYVTQQTTQRTGALDRCR